MFVSGLGRSLQALGGGLLPGGGRAGSGPVRPARTTGAEAGAGADGWGRVVERSGVNARELVRRASAWRHAGEDGLRAVTEAGGRPAAAVMVEAKARLVEARVPAGRIRIDPNP